MRDLVQKRSKRSDFHTLLLLRIDLERIGENASRRAVEGGKGRNVVSTDPSSSKVPPTKALLNDSSPSDSTYTRRRDTHEEEGGKVCF